MKYSCFCIFQKTIYQGDTGNIYASDVHGSQCGICGGRVELLLSVYAAHILHRRFARENQAW